ncbi:hypothetical protein [Pseudactinotalea sp. HY160]|uniref:hypothetical protein n=1 Tax=Pseudactinotalea sp. HY160 TaxID=2654490 RepID=UPI001D152D84|nr:hypothetical protein [Pseudactinotalea sp. HY160]
MITLVAEERGSAIRAFLDESSTVRTPERQEYLVCAALLQADECDAVRDELKKLLLPGQIKLHWSDESDRRKRKIVAAVSSLHPMNVVVRHLDVRTRRIERYRRKCLEAVYYEMSEMDVNDLILETRTPTQDGQDRAHIVALQGQGLDRSLRIQHQRGGDEPLLWIPDAVLGAINADARGEARHLEELADTLLIHKHTADSLATGESERP